MSACVLLSKDNFLLDELQNVPLACIAIFLCPSTRLLTMALVTKYSEYINVLGCLCSQNNPGEMAFKG